MRRTPGDTPRDDRIPVYFTASVDLSDGRSVPVSIVNVSHDGCQIDCSEMLPIGDTVQLNIAGCIDGVLASVRWSLSDKAGLRFIGPRVE